MSRILVVDDDKFVVIALSRLLTAAGYDVKSAYNGRQALLENERFRPELILLDFKLPDLDGFRIFNEVKKSNSNVKVIMITSFNDIRKAVTAIQMGALDYFTKPFADEEVLAAVKKALCRSEMDFRDEHIREMMGESEPLQRVLQAVEKVADKNIIVFLEGETGTGKELFARLIHHKSRRRREPFVVVDCGAISETLFESELFGHIKGAFTGAIADKKGKFELADGGTLFLDEINNLPPALQAKFLRVLQEQEIQRLGEEKPRRVDVRIIAASNNDIYEDVRAERFRQDLFYRLHEFKIDLPTLRQRQADIPMIAACFLKEISQDFEKQITGFSASSIEALQAHSWPGNIRELKNVIKSAVVLCDCALIEPEHLHLRNISNNKIQSEEGLLLGNFTDQAEIEAIKKALQKAPNKLEAARLLGISRSQFYKKLEKFGMKQ